MDPGLRNGAAAAARKRGCGERLLVLAPVFTTLALTIPVVAGLAGVLLPAFGYLPALGATSFSLKPFADLFAAPGLWTSLALSLGCGLAATAIAFAAVLLFLAGWGRTRFLQVVTALTSPLLAVPHAAAAIGLAFLIAPSGFLARLLSPWATGWARPPDLLVVHDPLGLAMVAGLAAKEIPFLLLMSLAALSQTGHARYMMVTGSLGYGRIAGFLLAVAPVLYARIRLPVYAVIAYATSVVDVAIVLGPTTPAPLAVRLVTWMGEPDLAMRLVASAGAVLQLGVTLLALLLWHLGERTANALCRAMAERGTRMARADRALAGASALPMTLAVVTIGSGIAVLALWSVAGPWFFPDALPQRLTLETWIRQGSMVARPLAISLAVGAAAAGIATLLVIACLANELVRARRPGRAAMILLYLPLIIPQVAFLFGLQILLIATGLDASFGALVAAHLVFVIPYVFLSLSDPWRGFDSRYEQAAAALGAGSWRRLVRVRLPMLTRPILTAAAVGFAVSVGLYLPTLLVAAGRLPTIATEAVALASGGDRRLLGVYALLQAVLPFIGFWIALAVPAMAFRHRNAMALP